MNRFDFDIEQYSYLWDGSELGWVLCNVAKLNDSPPVYFIVNKITNRGLIIENDELYDLLIKEMLKKNIEIIK